MRAVLLLVPLVEAFALPIVVERANLQKPHAEYVHILRQLMLSHPLPARYTYPQASTVCYILDYD
ncbi:MAG: hypothetical protein K2I92_00160 [Muribaculaceae bacterium]|nr:hypothetical protein [Muribaculaceae bacterium]